MANRLINEQSPYLLQHAHNPVDWYAWGDEPFERAKQENKPVLISIGYAACHWCHVMEHESFEHEEVAAYMNEHFINIKVDREEHPDVDHMYMDAVQAIIGSGGWPLNVFATPDRVPFYGGTYFPPRQAFNRPSWMQILARMNEIWHQQRDEVNAQTEQMLQYLRQASQIGGSATEKDWSMDNCRQIAESLLKQADTRLGGFGNAPKFPGSMAISFLLEHYHFTGYEPALKQALLSLDAMIEGGIYDQLGGGFARYATDAAWLVPHFEKMLYDNALLILSLCDAYSLTKKQRYKEIIEETIIFVNRELKDSSGAYYSALDADSEGVEGKFYTWTWAEWKDAVGKAGDPLAEAYFGVSENGNWEETNILHIAKPLSEVAAALNVPVDEAKQHIDELKKRLFQWRSARIRPLTDDKSLLSWNALMNLALTKSAVTLDEPGYLLQAEEHMQWMLQNFNLQGELMHVWKQGKARVPAKLDDYAYLIQAMLQLGAATGDNRYLLEANKWLTSSIEEFAHESGNFFYYTSARQADIPVRKVDIYDGALPSANAVMAHNLLLAGLYMEKNEWLEHAGYILQKMSDTAIRYAYSFGYWGMLLQRYAANMRVVMCVGSNADAAARQLRSSFIPHCFVITSEKEIFDIPVLKGKFLTNELLIFVCTQQSCLAPVTNAADALHLIQL
ncbi:MAG: thioredoxin domain-containing protein [Flavipsychrobacter sp.]